DHMGFNAVDFEVFNFPPTHDEFQPGGDPVAAFRYCEPGAAFDRAQIKCWKKQDAPVDLVSSGGHDVTFAERLVFPIRFILRHYPIRSQAHGERKVFGERRPRFLPAELDRGWHVQYGGFDPTSSFLRDASTLTEYDAVA